MSVAGEADPATGMVVNLTDLDRMLKEEVDRPLDHRNLNAEIPEFAGTVPTAENLARWIWDRVAARIAKEGWPCRLHTLRLTVTPNFSVELVSEEQEKKKRVRGGKRKRREDFLRRCVRAALRARASR